MCLLIKHISGMTPYGFANMQHFCKLQIKRNVSKFTAGLLSMKLVKIIEHCTSRTISEHQSIEQLSIILYTENTDEKW